MSFIPHIIDGRETESAAGQRFASVDPWTREPYAEVALGGPADADRAVRAARRAFDEGPWPRMGFAERGTLLHRAAANYRFFADHARLATGEALPMDTGHHACTRFEPAGVVVAIAPGTFR
jgi:aminomuconate-semialdehyde/2-hydroxymuconate-6-semialdehyde dehydrogenase